MGRYGETGDDPEAKIGQKGGCDQDPVHEVMDTVPKQDQGARCELRIGARIRDMLLTVLIMAMAPDDHLLQQKEQYHTCQHTQGNGMDTGPSCPFQGMRQQANEGRAKQRASSET